MTDNDKTLMEALDREKDAKFVHKGKVYRLENVIDLIHRLQATIEFVISSKNLAEASVKTLKAELDLAKAFHKEAVAERDLLNIQLKKARAEIERLKEYPKCVYEYDGDLTDFCLKSPCSNYKTVEQIKAEAIKEFAEKT